MAVLIQSIKLKTKLHIDFINYNSFFFFKIFIKYIFLQYNIN